jgi:nucleotide-binding universal stress UspA family protein
VFEKVLLAVDGSAESAKAVPVATDLAKKSDGEVLVFHAREFMIARRAAWTPRPRARRPRPSWTPPTTRARTRS